MGRGRMHTVPLKPPSSCPPPLHVAAGLARKWRDPQRHILHCALMADAPLVYLRSGGWWGEFKGVCGKCHLPGLAMWWCTLDVLGSDGGEEMPTTLVRTVVEFRHLVVGGRMVSKAPPLPET